MEQDDHNNSWGLKTNTQRKTLLSFRIFLGELFLVYSGFTVLLFLQSSINIEDGVGTASLTATYFTATIISFSFVPIMVKKLGIKKSLMVSYITYFIFMVANFYPVSYILIPAGMLVGIGEGSLWPVMSLFAIIYARKYSKFSGEDSTDYETKYIGYVMMSVQISMIFGNLLSYILLFGSQSAITNTNVTLNYSNCGINDCQDPDIVFESQNQYQPASQVTLYTVFGVMAGMAVVSMVIHVLLIRDVDVDESLDDKSEISKKENLCSSIWSITKSTLRMTVSIKALLISPVPFYAGIFITFVFIEVNRAFVACIIGVDKIGLMMVIFASSGTLSTFVNSKLANTFGHKAPFGIAYCMDLITYLFCLYWVPSEAYVWVLYLMYVIMGVSFGIWLPLINDMFVSYFPKDAETALSVCCFWFYLAFAVQNAWSTSLCVYVKVYIHIAIMCVSILCYGLAEYIYVYRKPKPTKVDATVDNDHLEEL